MRFETLRDGLERLVGILARACGWWLLVLSALTCVEMVSRKLFNYSLQGIDEIGGYTLAVIGALGFSYALVLKAHTRVDYLLGRMPPALQAFLNWLAMASLAAMVLFAVFRGFVVPSESIEFQSTSTSPLQTPMWIPHSLWFAGWLLFAIVATIFAVHATALLVRDRDRLNREYGPLTLDEEIAAEAGELLEPKREAA